MNIPTHANNPMNSLFPLSFRFLSLTLEQKTPTNITLSKLQLFTITTAGKEAYTTAWLYVYILKFTSNPHISAFFHGIYFFYVVPVV